MYTAPNRGRNIERCYFENKSFGNYEWRCNEFDRRLRGFTSGIHGSIEINQNINKKTLLCKNQIISVRHGCVTVILSVSSLEMTNLLPVKCEPN